MNEGIVERKWLPQHLRVRNLACALIGVVLQVSALTVQAQGRNADLSWSQCPKELQAPEARCGVVRVVEDYGLRSARSIPLHFALIRQTAPSRRRVLTVLLNGGPGYGGLAWFRGNAQLFGLPDSTPDLLVLDQRGSGSSGPISCAVSGIPWWMRTPADLRLCHDSLASGANLSRYTHRENSRDLDVLRQALGYQRMALYGLSYGARVALVYAAAHPAHVERLVLHSPAPVAAWPVLSAQALAALSAIPDAACRGTGCAEAAHERDRSVANALDSMAGAPRTVVFRRSLVVPPESLLVTRRAAALVLRDEFLGSEEERVRALRDDLTKGTSAAIARWYRDQEWMQTQFSIGPFMSETCQYDNAGSVGPDNRAPWTWEIVTAVRDACAAWPSVAIAPAPSYRPVRAPTLIILGDRDAIQAATEAERYRPVVERLDVLTVRGLGHSGLARCAQSFIQSWRGSTPRGRRDFSCADPTANLK